MATISYDIEACPSSSSTTALLQGHHHGSRHASLHQTQSGSRRGSADEEEDNNYNSSAGKCERENSNAGEADDDDETYLARRQHQQRISSLKASAAALYLRRTSTRILLGLLAAAAILVGLASTESVTTSSGPLLSYVASKAKDGSGYIIQTFTGSSSYHYASPYYTPDPSRLPPALSTLPDSLKRLTLISIWSGSDDKQPEYLNNFFKSAALNSKVADLLVIHITSDMSKCLSVDREDGIIRDAAASWNWENGGNIRIVCQSRETHLAEEADFLCSKEGWDCDEKSHKQVLKRLHERADEVNVDWKPLRGEMYKKYFIHPENPIWAWCDMDMHLGRLEHLPFPLISTVAITGISIFSPALLFLNGQLTIFNMAAPGLVGAWKNYAPLQTPQAFINPAEAADGGFAGGGIDETWLSAAYLRDGEGYAGTGLSWAIIPDVHGQDLFIPGRKFVVSGIDVLEVDSQLNRKEIEAVLKTAREQPPDEYAGWSDIAEVVPTQMAYGEDCIDAWFDKTLAQCVNPSSLTLGDQFTEIDSVRRATIVRVGNDPSGSLSMRLEPDHRPRRWQRKLFMHYQELKRQDWWWHLPPWFVGDDEEVMEFDWKSQVIWRMGEERQVDLWKSINSRLKEDGTADHVIDVAPKKAYKTSDEPARFVVKKRTAINP